MGGIISALHTWTFNANTAVKAGLKADIKADATADAEARLVSNLFNPLQHVFVPLALLIPEALRAAQNAALPLAVCFIPFYVGFGMISLYFRYLWTDSFALQDAFTSYRGLMCFALALAWLGSMLLVKVCSVNNYAPQAASHQAIRHTEPEWQHLAFGSQLSAPPALTIWGKPAKDTDGALLAVARIQTKDKGTQLGKVSQRLKAAHFACWDREFRHTEGFELLTNPGSFAWEKVVNSMPDTAVALGHDEYGKDLYVAVCPGPGNTKVIGSAIKSEKAPAGVAVSYGYGGKQLHVEATEAFIMCHARVSQRQLLAIDPSSAGPPQ